MQSPQVVKTVRQRDQPEIIGAIDWAVVALWTVLLTGGVIWILAVAVAIAQIWRWLV